MTYLAITKWDSAGRVIKYQPFDTQEDADAFVRALADKFPNAFACERPEGFDFSTWKVNAAGNCVEVDQEVVDAIAAKQAAAGAVAHIPARRKAWRPAILGAKSYAGGDEIDGLGFLGDAILGQFEAAAAAGELALTPEIDALLTMRASIKAAHPKPS